MRASVWPRLACQLLFSELWGCLLSCSFDSSVLVWSLPSCTQTMRYEPRRERSHLCAHVNAFLACSFWQVGMAAVGQCAQNLLYSVRWGHVLDRDCCAAVPWSVMHGLAGVGHAVPCWGL